MGVGAAGELGITALEADDYEALAPPLRSQAMRPASVAKLMLDKGDRTFEETDEEDEWAVEGLEVSCH